LQSSWLEHPTDPCCYWPINNVPLVNLLGVTNILPLLIEGHSLKYAASTEENDGVLVPHILKSIVLLNDRQHLKGLPHPSQQVLFELMLWA